MKINKRLALIAIVLLASMMRLVSPGKFPSGLYLDEVLYGLDAFSLIKTGKDIYGTTLPLAFQSSGYYPPVFTYVLAPFLLFLPLTSWVVRLPAALAGIGVIITSYFFTKTIVGKRNQLTPLIATFLLAFSPWHIHMSRVAFLNSFGIIFPLFATFLFMKSVTSKKPTKSLLIISAILFFLSTHVHYGYKLISPLILISLVVLFWRKLKVLKKPLIIIGIVLVITIASNWYAKVKFNSFFRVTQLSNASGTEIIKSYFDAFSVQFLFTSGDNNPLLNPWGKGQLFVIFLPLLIAGTYRLRSLQKQSWIILLIWLIVAPIPSALAGLGTHAVRLSPMIVPLVIIAGLGFEAITTSIRSATLRGSLSFLILGSVLINNLTFIRFYTSDYLVKSQNLWGQPQRQLIYLAIAQQDSRSQIVFKDNFNSMLAFYAFETQTPPNKLQKAILQPTTLQTLPAKNLDSVFFISTEQIIDPNWQQLLPKNTLLLK